MAVRLQGLTDKYKERSDRLESELLSSCKNQIHKSIFNVVTKEGFLDAAANEGMTKLKMNLTFMGVDSRCHRVAGKLLVDFVKETPSINGVKLKPIITYATSHCKFYYTYVEFDWTK